MLTRVLRGTFACGAFLLMACTQSSPTLTPTSTSMLSPTPGREPPVVSQDLGTTDPQSLPEALAPEGLGWCDTAGRRRWYCCRLCATAAPGSRPTPLHEIRR